MCCYHHVKLCLEVAGKSRGWRAELRLLDLPLNRLDDSWMDIGTDRLVAEVVRYVVDGDWDAIWWGVGVGALYGHALYRRARILYHTHLVSLGAVTRDVTTNKYRVFKMWYWCHAWNSEHALTLSALWSRLRNAADWKPCTNRKTLFILFDSRINGSSWRVEILVGAYDSSETLHSVDC